jgi:hypothetical protein
MDMLPDLGHTTSVAVEIRGTSKLIALEFLRSDGRVAACMAEGDAGEEVRCRIGLACLSKDSSNEQIS